MSNIPIMEIPVPTIDELGLDISNLLQERQYMKKLKEDCDIQIKQIDDKLGLQLDQKDIKTVVWEDYLIIRRQGSKPRPSLDRVLLLDAGVTPQQLKAGTRFGESGKPGITVRPISEAKSSGLADYISD